MLNQIKQLIISVSLTFLVATSQADDTTSITAFKELVAKFPKQVENTESQTSFTVTDVAFDVKKTDSAISPLLGIITFSVSFTHKDPTAAPTKMPFRMEIRIDDGKWASAKIIDVTRGAEVSDGQIFKAGPMKEFLTQNNLSK